MKHLALVFCFSLALVVGGCTTETKRGEAPEKGIEVDVPPFADQTPLQERLGMQRATEDLGYTEKEFDGCAQDGVCRPQYFSVVHFQLLCRDSEGTVSNVPTHLTPLTSDRVLWQLGQLNGDTSTDQQGFGKFTVVSERSTRGQSLILRIGKQFMSFTISEISKVVLPQNFCI